jgi:hypothetical protein
MRTKHFTLAAPFLLSITWVALADRSLDRDEIVQIFQQLTSEPRQTWIAAGTIEAVHDEYKAPKMIDANEVASQIQEKIQHYQSDPNKRELTEHLQKMQLDAIPFNVRYRLLNEYTMNSTVLIRFDGDRFYWEINVHSRTDSVKPDVELQGNFLTRQFNLEWNARRIFAWDGEEYTTYSLPGNLASVDSTGSTPHVVNGPLTAGFVPWGHGFYSYDSLVAADSSAEKKSVDGQTLIHLRLNNSDGSETLFVMDAEKDYALTSCTVANSPPGSITSRQYSGHQLVSGRWVPTTISIERYDASSNRLLERDWWDITRIDANTPEGSAFDVSYETDALVEHFSSLTGRPSMYRYSEMADTEQLLAERLAFAASEGTQLQNCATAALKHACSHLGQNVTNQQLAQLVSEPNLTTSLHQMKQFAESMGLHCRAVKTDIQTLENLSGCEAILHIPAKQHFVVLAGVDDDYVWSIDLASSKFFYCTDLDFFGMDWTEGTALLISDQPLQIQGDYVEIDDDQLYNIVGGSGYTCTRLLQQYDVVFCERVGSDCIGYYQVYYERWGCEAAESGSCSSSWLERVKESPCIIFAPRPWMCTVTGEWTYYYMRACQ